MIIRVWTALATPEGAAQCEARFTQEILPGMKRVDGYRGAWFLRRLDGDQVELVVLSRWQSLEAARAWAGPDVDRAVVGEDAKTILTRSDPRVRHYEVALEDPASPPGTSRP